MFPCIDVQPCFRNSSIGEQSGGKWTFPAALLDADVLHTFTVVISKAQQGSLADTRTASAQVTLVPRPAQLPIPTGSIKRPCAGEGCSSSRHPADYPLKLVLELDQGFDAAKVTYQWHSDQVASINSTEQQLVLQPEQLTDKNSLKIGVVMTLDGETGSTSITVPINAKPRCAAGGQGDAPAQCLIISNTSDVFDTASFTVSASNYYDNDKLR